MGPGVTVAETRLCCLWLFPLALLKGGVHSVQCLYFIFHVVFSTLGSTLVVVVTFMPAATGRPGQAFVYMAMQ